MYCICMYIKCVYKYTYVYYVWLNTHTHTYSDNTYLSKGKKPTKMDVCQNAEKK